MVLPNMEDAQERERTCETPGETPRYPLSAQVVGRVLWAMANRQTRSYCPRCARRNGYRAHAAADTGVGLRADGRLWISFGALFVPEIPRQRAEEILARVQPVPAAVHALRPSRSDVRHLPPRPQSVGHCRPPRCWGPSVFPPRRAVVPPASRTNQSICWRRSRRRRWIRPLQSRRPKDPSSRRLRLGDDPRFGRKGP